MNTFGLNRPVYSFGLGLMLTLIDPGLPPTEPGGTFYPTDNRYYLATECTRVYEAMDLRKFETS